MSITAYLINLDRSPDRLARMQARFDEIGAAFVRIPAVDGKALSDAARKAACVPHKAWLPRTAMAAYVAQLGQLTETVSASVKDSVKPLNERVTATVERLQAAR